MISIRANLFILCLVSVAAVFCAAETHTVHFDNRCGFGTPMLIQGRSVLSIGGDFTILGPLISAIAFLQTGFCGFLGEGCTVIELSLVNTIGSLTSTADITLIPPHQFSVTTGFGYFNGCDGLGADCPEPDCSDAIREPGDDEQVECFELDVNLAITFCD